MTIKDSFFIGDVVGQHAGKSKVNSGHIGESASRRCNAARLGTGYALEFASAGQGFAAAILALTSVSQRRKSDRHPNGRRLPGARLHSQCE
jgi:hypothetical protein